MLGIRLGCASISKRVVGHIHWEFFWRRNISFRFGQFVSLLTEVIFSFNFWRPLLLFHWAKPIDLCWTRQDPSRVSCCCSAVVLQA